MDRFKELLVRRSELCKEVLDLTEGAVFTQSVEEIEAETQRFAELYEKREALISELGSVHSQIGEEGYAALKNSGDEEVLNLLRQSEASIGRIIELDKLNRNAGTSMLETVKQGIKRIKQGRNISLKYSGELLDTDGYLLDNKS